MKIAILGAGGTIGQRVAREAAERGHEVIAVTRDPSRFRSPVDGARVVQAEATDASSVAAAVHGADAVVSAVGPGFGPGAQPDDMVGRSARALIDGLTEAGVRRVLVVGGAGSLEVAPGMQLVDTPEFPEGWKGVALAHRDVLDLFRSGAADALEWTYVSPAALIEPGERTGEFRVGGDQLLTDGNGESRISAEDYAVAIVDELENGRFVRERIGVAY
ncbi:MAG TPA: NAD(P)-dependent oxidoreductase [Longimicrobiaceae bacterium]|jgi:putative NADH-flavin reductase|nr:NAD(P)-dependent oxidoreductase [Longimicrobiaceae bacterium]